MFQPAKVWEEPLALECNWCEAAPHRTLGKETLTSVTHVIHIVPGSAIERCACFSLENTPTLVGNSAANS